jgi:hypothetical protein
MASMSADDLERVLRQKRAAEAGKSGAGHNWDDLNAKGAASEDDSMLAGVYDGAPPGGNDHTPPLPPPPKQAGRDKQKDSKQPAAAVRQQAKGRRGRQLLPRKARKAAAPS